MIEIATAIELIQQQVTKLGSERIDWSSAIGRRLAMPVLADVDSPPHDKSLMDGFAVIANDVVDSANRSQASRTWRILETIKAGAVPTQSIAPGACSRIMTGAPLPRGADAVVMVEMSRPDYERGEVVFQVDRLAPGQHVMRRAQSMRCGDCLFEPGHLIRPVDIGVLAEVGATELTVFRRPRVAVLATGDELVPAQVRPGPSQIRNSNGPMVAELARAASAEVCDLGIARDDLTTLTNKIRLGLESDVLVLTGGVSEGLVDLVPQTLQRLGVQCVFHKVSIKPGKPIWFGYWQSPVEERRCYVFGLPGNPVSSLVCFQIFVQPCLEQLAGGTGGHPPLVLAELAVDHQVRGPRPTYWPAVTVARSSRERLVRPLLWQGSSDLRCLAAANTLIFFPSREQTYQAGETVSVLEW